MKPVRTSKTALPFAFRFATKEYFMSCFSLKRSAFLATVSTHFAFVIAMASFLPGPFAQGSDQIPGAKSKHPVLLRGGVIHTVSGETLHPGCVLIEQGKIKLVAKEIAAPSEKTQVIDLNGKHVYPGLIESTSQLGLVEIDSVRATIDTTEAGRVNSNVRTQVAFNPDSEAIPVARANGVLLALSVPSGQFVNGRSSLMQLDGWTWEDMAVRSNVAMHVQWPRFSAPRMGRRGGGGGRGPAGGAGDAQQRLEEFKQLLETTRIYAAGRERDAANTPLDPRLEGMIPVVRGELPIMVDADDVQQIQSAVAFCKENQIKLIVYGGMGAAECATLLQAEHIPVILAGVYRLPRPQKPYDEAYTLPKRLHDAGVTYAISGAGRFGASTVRNLPYHAATAVAYGLDRDSAIKSMTLDAAKILGVSDRVGSIEAGKDATLFVSDGDILEIQTLVTDAFVQGRPVDLTSHHTELYRKYKTKYDRIQEETATP